MIEIFKNTNYDFLGKKGLAFGLSTILLLAGVASICYRAFDGKDSTSPFNLGVDFVGGTLATVKFNTTPDVGRLREALGTQGIETAKVTIQPVGDQIGQPPRNEVLVRLPNLVNVVRQEGQSETAAKATDDADVGKQKILAALATLNDSSTAGRVDLNALGKDQIAYALASRAGLDGQRADEIAARIVEYREKSRDGLIGNISEVRNLSGVDPQIGAALEQGFFTGVAAVKSVEAVSPQVGADLRNRAIFVSLLSCLGMLIYVAFRFKSWGFGIGSVVAVFHDVLVTLGFFSIMQWEINLTVIAALREMLRFRRRDSLEKLANDAVNETLSRTVITNGLTFLTVFALVLFGGEVLKSFSWALFIGIIVGSYSTVYIASPFMLMWENWRGAKSTYIKVIAGNAGGNGNTPVANAATTVTSRMLAVAGVSAKRRKKGR
jgi:preprotein translocase subunit SecF